MWPKSKKQINYHKNQFVESEIWYVGIGISKTLISDISSVIKFANFPRIDPNFFILKVTSQILLVDA